MLAMLIRAQLSKPGMNQLIVRTSNGSRFRTCNSRTARSSALDAR